MAISKKTKDTAVDEAARQLRQMAVRSGEGAFLGSEEDLIEKVGFSRPTLRQAAALVAREGLIFAKRGVNGGFYASLPDTLAVTRLASIYLSARGANMIELIQAVGPIRCEIAKLAARSKNPGAHIKLTEFLEKEERLSPPEISYRGFLASERKFALIISDLSANGALALFLNILYDLIGEIDDRIDVYADHEERIARYRELRKRIAVAILEGDEDMAVAATKRCSSLVAEWMIEDLAQRGSAETLGQGLR